MLQPPNRTARCADGHAEGGPLCASCEAEHVRTGAGDCRLCGELTPGHAVMVAVLGLVGVGSVLVAACKHSEALAINVGILRLAWPRFKQSFAILISNFQVR